MRLSLAHLLRVSLLNVPVVYRGLAFHVQQLLIRRPWGACWMVAEGGVKNPLPFRTREGGPGFVSLQVPTSEAAVSADTHAFARLPPKICPCGFCGERPQNSSTRAPNPWGPGPQFPGDLAHRPLNHGSGLKTLGCYHNPQSADLGGRWMASEGALQPQERVFAPAFQPLGAGPRAPGHLANKPLSPASRQPSRVKNSKNAPVLIGS